MNASRSASPRLLTSRTNHVGALVGLQRRAFDKLGLELASVGEGYDLSSSQPSASIICPAAVTAHLNLKNAVHVLVMHSEDEQIVPYVAVSANLLKYGR